METDAETKTVNAVNSVHVEASIEVLTTEVYRSFCENCGGNVGSLDSAFSAVVDEYGLIASGSTIDTLMIETIRYTIRKLWESRINES